MEKLPADVLQMLNTLAVKLGTTIEHLWTVLTNQATINAWLSGLWILLAFIGLPIILSKMRKWYNSAEEGYRGDERRIYAVIISIAISIVSLVVIVVNTNILIGVFNPEYVALKDLIGMMSKLAK